MLSHLALASTTRHGHSSQNARYIQFVKEHAAGFSAVRVSDLCVRNCHSELVGLGGLEPPASPLSGARSNHLSYRPKSEPGRGGGASRDRTDDLKLAKLALSQLSYGPIGSSLAMVGRVGVEPTTSRLSGVRSNHLSYRPPLVPGRP